MSDFPYLARTTLKYKSPHATDLSFAKDETIRVTGQSPDDEDWLIGETMDGSKSGGFPKDFVVEIEGDTAPEAAVVAPESAPTAPESAAPPPLPKAAPAPPSPKLEAAELPPSSRASPAPVRTAQAPASPSVSTAEGEDSSPKKSMKDRLAFFAAAQTKAAPPPPLKPKLAAGGLTWSQRQKMRQEQEAKEAEGGKGEDSGGTVAPIATAVPAAQAPSSPAVASPSQSAPTGDGAKEGAGMSAADAQSSIGKGTSLKERMAALRGAGAFGAPETKTAPPPPAKPSGKVWSRPPAPEPAPEEEGVEATPKPPSAETEQGEETEKVEGEGDEPAEAAEEDEEEQEKARRAAITARMAKLGARGPMGMAPAAPPKPARKPTMEATSPSIEKAEPVVLPGISIPGTSSTAPEIDSPVAEQKQPESMITESASPPQSIAMPAIPRRTAGPRRPARAPAPAASSEQPTAAADVAPDADLDKRVEKVHSDGTISPPPAMMVADEEPPLPVSDADRELERVRSEAGAGPDGAVGAQAAGISTSPVKSNQSQNDPPSQRALPPPPTMVPMHSPAPSGPVSTDEDDDDEPQHRSLPPLPAQGILGLPKDEVELKHEQDAQEHAREEGAHTDEHEEEEESSPPPPLPRRLTSDKPTGPRPLPSLPTGAVTSLPPPPQENETAGLGEDTPGYDEPEELSEDGVPPPPPQRQPSMRLPPRPPVLESDEEPETDAPVPPPPIRRPTLPPPPPPAAQSEEGSDDEEQPAPPPPPRREPSILVPIHKPLEDESAPVLSSPTSPQIATSPTKSRTLEQSVPPPADAQTEEDDDAARRKGIAARMAKLGGIKFGMPPPVPKVKRMNTNDTESAPSPVAQPPQEAGANEDQVASPISPVVPKRAVPSVAEATGSSDDTNETPEEEAERRRRTLARLRAGGTLGYGMFGQQHTAAEPLEDERGLEAVPGAGNSAVPAASEQDEEALPSTPARPAVPANRPPPSVPATPAQEIAESDAGAGSDDEAPPPPPPGSRPPVPANRPIPPPPQPAEDEEDNEDEVSAPPPPPARPSRTMTADVPPSPIRTASFKPPPPLRQPSVSALGQPIYGGPGTVDEPTELAPSTPVRSQPPPPVQTGSFQPDNQPGSPRRSMSIASRQSTSSIRAPSSPGLVTRQDSMNRPMSPAARTSFAGSRPGFNELQAASQDAGTRVLRAAQGLFGQGRKAYVGDGSPAGFVMTVYEQAHLPRPEQSWGQAVYEQEAGSVLKKYDDARQGDVVAFHDAKFKGKKGLSSYNQHVGSVQDPLVGVIVESEQKKHKLRVLQVERGMMEEVSYRCDDLKSGRLVVYRPGI